MSWSYLQERGAAYSEGSCLAGSASGPSSETITAAACCSNASEMASCRPSPFGMTCEPSLSGTTTSARLSRRFAKWLTGLSSKQASPANRSALQESDKEPTTTATAGPGQSDPYVKYDRPTHSWRTFQACLLPGILTPSSVTWPRAGMMQDGECYRRLSWERRISEIGSGLLPTPRTQDDKDRTGKENPIVNGRVVRPSGQNFSLSLGSMAARNMWPTSSANNQNGGVTGLNGGSGARAKLHKMVGREMGLKMAGGQLNPDWTEWLMGWPIHWTSLEPLRKEFYDDWKQRTQSSAAHVFDGEVRPMWWCDDPSETPYRPRSNEQRRGKHYDSLSSLPHERTYESRNMGEGSGENCDVRNLWDGISTQTQPQVFSVREPGVPEREGEIISRTAVGVENRVDRLKAIGNGQVSSVVAAAWHLLRPGE